MDFLGKLNEVKQKMDEVKSRLDTITVTGEAGDGLVKVISTANRKISDIKIDESLLSAENKEQVEELLTVAINRAIVNADNVSESEMRAASSGFMPDIPGLT